MFFPGDIYQHDRFYLDQSTGEFKRKYLVILSTEEDCDLVARLLTSRPHGRPEKPPCYHGNPYAGYYLGVLGGQLGAKSWIDLRGFDDLDIDEFRRTVRKGLALKVMSLAPEVLFGALECAASADDTTRQQERLIRDTLARLR